MDFFNRFKKDETGSMFTAVLGVVAVVGVLSVSVYSLISGPVRTAATVTAKTKATNNMITAAKILLTNAVDTDADSVPEAPEFVPDAAFPTAGLLPTNLGVEQLDPWGTPYAYCTWDHGATTGSADRLAGIDDNSKNVIAIISAGQNRAFEITCADINGAGDFGVDSSANIDDMLEKYTIADAAALIGGGGESIWDIVAPDEIKYDERVGIGGAADPAAKLNVTGDAKVSGDLSAAAGTVTGLAGAFTNLSSTNVNLDGGNIDGTAIGVDTPSTGRFTNVSTTSVAGTNTLLGQTIISGGTINNTPIGGNPGGQSTGRFTLIEGTSLTLSGVGHVANIWEANIDTANIGVLTVDDTDMVSNLTANYLGAVGQDDAFFRNAANMNAGVLDPDRLPAFTGDVSEVRTDATNMATTVVGIQNQPVSTTDPNLNEVLAWDGAAWVPSPVGDGGVAVTETDPTVNPIGKTTTWSANCNVGEIPKSTGPNDWECATDAGGFANPATTDLDMNGHKIVSVSSVQMTSDFRLKKEIEPMTPMLRRLEQIQPVTFYWNEFAKKKGYDKDKHLGLIAQDVEAVFPEAIITNAEGIKGIDYSSLTAVMFQAIRELSEQNKMLQGQLYDIKRQQNQEK